MKSFIRLILLILLIILISCQEPQPEANCIPGKNCPYNQGECSDDQCSCKDGFYTLLNKNKEPVDQIYCNYKQISNKLMLLFEVLFPGSGQLYSRQWIYGGIKLCLFLCFLINSFSLQPPQILIPKCCIIIKKAFLGGDKDDKNEDKEEDKKEKKKEDKKEKKNELKDNLINNKEDNDEKDDDKKELELSEVQITSQYEKDQGGKQKNNSNNIKGLINDCMALEELNLKEFVFGSKKTSCNSCFKKFMELVLYIFWIVYAVDIYLIFFKIYPDGNGIPYAD